MKRSFAAIAAIVVTSVALVAVELTARLVDGYHLNSLRLEVSRERPPRAAPAPTTGSQKLEGENDALPFVRELPVAAGVDREWFTMPLPARPPVKADPVLVARMEKYRGGVDERANYEWNWRSVTGAVCRGEHPTFRDIFKQFDDIFVFDPTDGSDEPPYRFLPNIAYSSGLQTNTYGWRGPDVPLNKPPRAVRLAFIGASTTIGAHGEPFSFPELTGLWLSRWARVHYPDIEIEVINAGREGVNSRSLPAIVRQEILPLEPDLVYYDYDGANQFWPGDFIQTAVPPRPSGDEPEHRWFAAHSAIGRRLESIVRQATVPGSEPPKPPLTVHWPTDLNESDPDLADPRLPISLPQVLGDMDGARDAVSRQGAAMVLTSIPWLVYSGMVLDPVRDAGVMTFLNHYWPFSYAHMRRYLDFKTRVFRKYAVAHNLDFVDVSGVFPRDSRLFNDGIHMTRAGIHLQAWVVFNGLVPVLDRRLASHQWPRPARHSLSKHPAFPGRGRLVPMTEVSQACGADGKPSPHE